MSMLTMEYIAIKAFQCQSRCYSINFVKWQPKFITKIAKWNSAQTLLVAHILAMGSELGERRGLETTMTNSDSVLLKAQISGKYRTNRAKC